MKKRILSIVLAICLMLSIVPITAFAEGNTSTAPSVSAYATKEQLMDDTFAPNASGTAKNIGKLLFGKSYGGEQYEWYILGEDTYVEGDNTVIFAASSMGKAMFENDKDSMKPFVSSYGVYGSKNPSEVCPNHYGASDLRVKLQEMETDNFTKTEQGMMNDTTVTTLDLYNQSIHIDYTTTDKLYALYGFENDKIISAGTRNQKKLAADCYWNSGNDLFWLRWPTATFSSTDRALLANPSQSVLVFFVNSSFDVRPASNLNLSSVLFASAATVASSGTATSGIIVKDANGEPKAMTLRLDGSSKNIGTVTYSTTTGDIEATKGSTTGNVALVVQGNDGTNDWYYSKQITKAETVNVSTIKSALGLSADIDLSVCEVWLETTEDNVTYAVTVKGCSTEAELRNSLDTGVTSITLVDDINLSSTLDLSDKIITLNLNGHILKGNIKLADTSAAPESILTLIDSNPALSGVLDGKIDLTRGNSGTASHLYANGGTVTGMVSMPSYVGGIFCTSDTPTVFKGYVGNYGEIHGGIFYGSVNEDCIREKTVTFMNGSNRYALEVVADGKKATAPIKLKRDGYEFVGWYNGDTKYNFTEAVTENITLTAKWVLNNVSTEAELRNAIDSGATSIKLVNDINLSSTLDLSKKNIKLDLNGHVISGQKIYINSGLAKANLTLLDSNPTAAHTDSTLPLGGVVKSKISIMQDGGSYHDCILYANGGTVTSEFYTNTNAVAIKCTNNTPTAFTGKISGYTHIYAGIYYGTIASSVKIEGKKATFKIDNNIYAYEIVSSGNNMVAPISPSVKAGYQTFNGWYNGNTKYTFGSALSQDITLTAKFSNPLTYNIKYDLDGGTATNPTSYTVESEAITLNNPTKTNYTFTGWSGTDLTGEDNMTVKIPKGSIGNRTYTAHFSLNKYRVSLTSTVDGADDSDTVATLTGGGLYKIGTNVTVTAPEKAGFTFKGWYKKVGDTIETKPQSNKLSYSFIAEADVSLVAVYVANENISLNVYGDMNAYSVNGTTQTSNSFTQSFKAGTSITLAYTGSGNFCYWKNDSGNIVSRNKEYTFTLVSSTTLTAVAVGDSTGSEESGYNTLVEFVSYYGQVIQVTTWNSKDDVSGKTLPKSPSKIGGTFKYWSLDGENEAKPEDILAAIDGITTRITVVPVYEEITTKYKVTVQYPSDSGKANVVYDNQKIGDTLTVTADSIDGKEFAYWSSDADGTTKLSYNQSYFLLVSGDTTLYPIYSETAVEEQPVVAITNVFINNVNDNKKLCFEVTRSIPEKYELIEQGVIYSVTDTYSSNEADMVIGAGSVYKFVSSNTTNNGVFIANMNVTGHEDSKLYVKGYVIVKNTETGNTETIYTDMVAKSYNDLTQN